MEIALSDLKERYAFCDPAGGKQVVKRVRARSAIVVVAPDWMPTPRIFVLLAWAARCTTPVLIDKIIEVYEALRPKVIGIEANAMQSLFAGSVAHVARLQGKRLPILPVNQPTKIDKDFRIRTILQPVVAYGRLFMLKEQRELEAELRTFPMSVTKDLADALASAVALVPARPTKMQKSDEAESLARYLRESGVAPSLIEQRIRELTGGPVL